MATREGGTARYRLETQGPTLGATPAKKVVGGARLPGASFPCRKVVLACDPFPWFARRSPAP